MFAADERILFLAPHPDDEALAAGGLLQRAFAARVPTRVVYLTSGDNNPWAQRLVERRWQIGPQDRKRWGERRNGEAIAALRTLGGKEEDALFWRYPDQGLTDLLMRGIPALPDGLLGQVDAWRPTLVLLPAAEDAHPDHSALHVLFTLATAALQPAGFVTWRYLVHPPKLPSAEPAQVLSLNPAEVGRKLAAILAHQTQVAGSRRRFTGYARSEEHFHGETGNAVPRGLVRHATTDRDGVRVELALSGIRSPELKMLLALRTRDGDFLRWSLRVPTYSGDAFLRDEVTGSLLHPVAVRREGSRVSFRLPDMGPVGHAFLKVCARAGFFDRSGWIPLQTTAPTSPRVGLAGSGSEGLGQAVPNRQLRSSAGNRS